MKCRAELDRLTRSATENSKKDTASGEAKKSFFDFQKGDEDLKDEDEDLKDDDFEDTW